MWNHLKAQLSWSVLTITTLFSDSQVSTDISAIFIFLPWPHQTLCSRTIDALQASSCPGYSLSTHTMLNIFFFKMELKFHLLLPWQDFAAPRSLLGKVSITALSTLVFLPYRCSQPARESVRILACWFPCPHIVSFHTVSGMSCKAIKIKQKRRCLVSEARS